MAIEVAFAHYSACDGLGLRVAEQLAMGGDVSHRIHATLLAAVLRLAKNAGITPWTLLPHGGSLFVREDTTSMRAPTSTLLHISWV